jgi:hypothetical protein
MEVVTQLGTRLIPDAFVSRGIRVCPSSASNYFSSYVDANSLNNIVIVKTEMTLTNFSFCFTKSEVRLDLAVLVP